MSWILTYTGRQFWPLDPRPEDVCIEDIAHALSMICRFTGHTRSFYSVAQHSCHVAQVVSNKHKLAALLHDAPEAYLCDIARPVKQHESMQAYRDAEARLEAVISDVFDVDLRASDIVIADERMLYTERRDLMSPAHWIIDKSKCYKPTIVPWAYPSYAERQFLERFYEYRG